MKSFDNREERLGEEKHLWVVESTEDFLELGERGKNKEVLLHDNI